MTFEAFFNGTIISIAAGLGISGMAAMAAAVRRRNGHFILQEPLFSVALFLLYITSAYVLGVAFGWWLNKEEAPWFFIQLVMYFLAVHACLVYYLRAARLQGKIGHATQSVESSALQARMIGIKSVYDGANDPKLRDAVKSMVKGNSNMTLLIPEFDTFFEQNSVLSNSVHELCKEGITVKIISTNDQPIKDPVLQQRCRVLGVEGVLPPVWVVLVSGQQVLFSLQNRLEASRFFYGEITASNPQDLPTSVGHLVDDICSFAESGQTVATIQTATSPQVYKEKILEAEANAFHIDRIPKRIFVVFKDEATVMAIAKQRFGPGSPSVAHYVEEHKKRRSLFFTALQRGMVCRELYSRVELMRYVSQRRHGSVVLHVKLILKTLNLWKDAIRHQDNYIVGVTDDPLPFKYEVVDRRLVIMHEAVDVSTLHRLNGLFIEGNGVSKRFMDDFEVIWERVQPKMRDKNELIAWIDNELYPLALQENK